MIPSNITKEHILQAIDDFDKNGLRYPLGNSRVHELLFNGKRYPPKHIVIIANEFANGKLLSYEDLTSYMAQRYLVKLSDEFIIQNKNTDLVKELVEKYKQELI